MSTMKTVGIVILVIALVIVCFSLIGFVFSLCLLYTSNRDVTSEEIGMATLEGLIDVDDVAYVRFASVYKGFEDTEDFAREIGMLVKTTAPKLRG